MWIKQGRSGARGLKRLMDKPERWLITILVGNNLVNVLFSSVFAIYLSERGVSDTVILILSPAVVLLFGENIPKSITRASADKSAIPAATVVNICRVVLFPVVVTVEGVIAFLRKRFKFEAEQTDIALSRMELVGLVRGGIGSDHPDIMERTLLAKTIELGTLKIGDIMTPRTAVSAIPVTLDSESVRKLFMSSGLSRLPIYENDLDHTIGMISAKDFIDQSVKISDVIRPLPIIPETAQAMVLTSFFRKNRTVFAGVVDEYGGFAGVVTLEDLLEELLGPISDEYDTEQIKLIQIKEDSWAVDGAARLSHLNQTLGLNLPRTHNSSIGGLLTELAEGIPAVGTKFSIGKCKVQVLKADNRGVKQVLINRSTHNESILS